MIADCGLLTEPPVSHSGFRGFIRNPRAPFGERAIRNQT